MALLSLIRRWHFREGLPIPEIERRTGLSRNTIRKYLRSGKVEPRFKCKVDDLAGHRLHEIIGVRGALHRVFCHLRHRVADRSCRSFPTR